MELHREQDTGRPAIKRLHMHFGKFSKHSLASIQPNESGVVRLLWRSNAPSDPNPYTSLSQFHRTVKPSAHPDSPLARKLPYPGSAGSRASHMSPTPSNGRPHYVTSKVTSGERKTTVHSAARTRPKSTSVPKRECKTTVHSAACTRPKSKSVPTEATEQSQPKATPSLI